MTTNSGPPTVALTTQEHFSVGPKFAKAPIVLATGVELYCVNVGITPSPQTKMF